MTGLWNVEEDWNDDKDDFDLYEGEDLDPELGEPDLDEDDVICPQCEAIVEDGLQCPVCGFMVEI
jgi:rubrerythrin